VSVTLRFVATLAVGCVPKVRVQGCVGDRPAVAAYFAADGVS
jgi:hypothetical protein